MHADGRGVGDPKSLYRDVSRYVDRADFEEGIAPPRELVLAHDIEAWGWQAVMGEAPADYNLLLRMSAAMSAFRAIRALRAAKGKEIHRALTEEQRDLIAWMRQNGLMDCDDEE